MRRVVALVLLVVLVAAALVYRFQDRPTRSAGPGEPTAAELAPLVDKAALTPCFGPLVAAGLPRITLPCLDGSGPIPVVGETAATPTVVNVYGSWCAPCAEEMPVLRQLYDLAGDQVRLIGVDTADDPRQALLFAADLGQRWPALRDDDGLVSRALGGGAPKTLFVTADGRIAYVHRQAYRSLTALRADVRKHLGVVL